MIEFTYKKTSGFTLMEIMVVIIVIAVLASVAGPMITEITNSGRVSATKSQISALRAALITYAQDTGAMPYVGDKDKKDAYEAACGQLLYEAFAETDSAPSEDGNVLVNLETGQGIKTSHPYLLASGTYKPDKPEDSRYSKRWKGPYMDGEPSDFMMDPWEWKIRYRAISRSIYLISGGQDYQFDTGNIKGTDTKKDPLHDDYTGDDIMTSVHRVRTEFK